VDLAWDRLRAGHSLRRNVSSSRDRDSVTAARRQVSPATRRLRGPRATRAGTGRGSRQRCGAARTGLSRAHASTIRRLRSVICSSVGSAVLYSSANRAPRDALRGGPPGHLGRVHWRSAHVAILTVRLVCADSSAASATASEAIPSFPVANGSASPRTSRVNRFTAST